MAQPRKKQTPENKPQQANDNEQNMQPRPQDRMEHYQAANKLEGCRALITGGDSGIGRAVAIGFAKEGADVAIIYHENDQDAEETRQCVEQEGRTCLMIRGDIGDAAFCRDAVRQAAEELGGLDILVNNAGEQHPQEKLEDITPEQMERTFRTNIFGAFFMTQAALEHLEEGSSIINTTSITSFQGHPKLLDYSATKGAMTTFTRSLSQVLAERGIRVNAVAPGPIWTPLIPSTFTREEVEKFGKDTPLKRPGQPDEVAPSFIFLASQDASYMTGQILHPNGGEIIGG
jgi:NAD(P)-dependent dehydrogenase (short-subunit alcohol dehydrogenase family)